MIRLSRTTGCTVLLATLLCACSGQPMLWNPSDYTVKSGDTLYSIAWRYEIDPEDLARWNGLPDSSMIRPGQRLHMRESQQTARVASSAVTETSAPPPTATKDTASEQVITVQKGDTLYALAKRHRLDARQLVSANQLKPPYLIHPGQKLYTRPQAVARATTRPAASAVTVPTATPASTPTVIKYPAVVRWQWPVRGKLLSRFSSQRPDGKGIDIAGREGVAIRAAAAGKVVYSGNGLISFGNLVIIKHNDSYLSAYAHNRKLLVAEGEVVKAGQSIAELGKSGADKPMLHFEIRKRGKPVDPLRYLPSS